MRTLGTELGQHLDGRPSVPRWYADANVPAGVVGYMRQRLGWDVFFVLEHPELRRAKDVEHYRTAATLRRILLSLDHDFFDDKRFPPAATAGTVIVSASDERTLIRILRRIETQLLGRRGRRARRKVPVGWLSGRKIHAHVDWP